MSNPPNDTVNEGAWTVNEFLHIFKIGRSKLYSEVHKGNLILHKLGKKTIIIKSDGRAWLHALPRVGA